MAAPPLNRQTVPVLLSSLGQKAPQQTGVTGSLDVCQNMVALKGDQTTGFQGRAGGLEFWPRPGVSAVSRSADQGSITTGLRMATLGTSLLLQTGNALYRKATDLWHRVSPTMPIVGVKSTPTASNTLNASSTDSAYVNGYLVSAVTTNPGFVTGAVSVLVLDATGATVVNSVIAVGNVESAKVVVSGNIAVVFWQASAGTTIIGWKFDSTQPSATFSTVAITTHAAFGFPYDAQAVSSSGTIAVAWLDTGTSTYQLSLLTVSNMTTGGSVNSTIGGFSTFSFLANDWSTNELFAAYVGGGVGMNTVKFNAATLANLGSSLLDISLTYALNITGTRVGASLFVAATTNIDGTSVSGAPANAYDYRIVSSTGGAVATVMRGMCLASKAIIANGTTYAMARYRGPNQGSFFLIDLIQKTSVARAAQDLAYVGQTFANDHLSGVGIGATSNTLQTAGLKVIANAVGGAAYIGAVAIAWTLSDATVGRGVELNGGVHFPGAQPYLYDGQVLVEDGFPIAPEISDTPAQAVFGGAGLTPLAAYTIRFVYSWIDAAGNLHRSAPSAPVAYTLTGTNNQLTLSIPTLRNTRKTGVCIEIYSTIANGDGNPVTVTYYQVVPFGAPLLNDPTVDRVSYTFNTPDTTFQGGEPLYTDGGILDNLPPAPCKAFIDHRGRLIASGIDGDPQAIWFSKDVNPGFGIAFNDGLVSRLKAVIDPITSVISMDSFAVACTVGGTTWASSDQFPDDTGTGGVPSFVQYSSMVGCTNAGLMARTDDGVTMWGGAVVTAANTPPKSIWRCSRGLAFEYLGASIEQDAIGFTPVAAFAVPSQNQIRIVGTDSAGISCALVYESIFGSWSTWRYTAQVTALVDGIMWNGVAAYLCADGTVLTESPILIDDLGTPASVAHIVTLSTLNFAQVGGYQRVYGGNATGRVLGSGGFTAQVDQSFDGTAIARKTIACGAGTTALNLEFDPGNAGKCSAAIVTFSDGSNAANSAFTLAGMTFDVGIKPHSNRLPPSRRAT